MFGIVFAGQGSQYLGMGKDIYLKYYDVQKLFDEASIHLKMDVAKICFDGSIGQLNDTSVTQPLVYLVGYAYFQVFMKQYGIKPNYIAGHSLGEITALASAGALTFSDGLMLARQRGKLMKEQSIKTQGIMVAISGLSIDSIRDILNQVRDEDGSAEIACMNSSSQYVISGNGAKMDKIIICAEKNGGRARKLNVYGGYHSILMEPIKEELRDYLSKVIIHPLDIPVFANATSMLYPATWAVPRLLLEQITRPVLWSDIMSKFRSLNLNMIIDMGPGESIKHLVEKNNPYTPVFSMSNSKDISMLSDKIARKKENIMTDINRNFILDYCLTEIVGCRRKRIESHEHKDYVSLAYKYLTWLSQSLTEKQAEISLDEALSAIKLTQEAVNYKLDIDKNDMRVTLRILKKLGLPEGMAEDVQESSLTYFTEFFKNNDYSLLANSLINSD